ncbi:hypothetical protein GOBAR_AA24473 [Gossypium barbadense]|uniref:RanBP2-type domain-containing protein n=1 Tax=Gossypium barbadense TaxID=3634 RepID=A0A2P5WYM6_GOSBA|nr:hypothetical protein GOBAR_AA24473 [Gossypium barbadense]
MVELEKLGQKYRVALRCSFMNFSRNTRCLKCKEKGPKRVATDDVQMKKGDWNCPGPIFYDLLDDLATSMLVLLLQTKSHAYLINIDCNAIKKYVACVDHL